MSSELVWLLSFLLLLCLHKAAADGGAIMNYKSVDPPTCPSACQSAGYIIAWDNTGLSLEMVWLTIFGGFDDSGI
jgi:hypothetical protein